MAQELTVEPAVAKKRALPSAKFSERKEDVKLTMDRILGLYQDDHPAAHIHTAVSAPLKTIPPSSSFASQRLRSLVPLATRARFLSSIAPKLSSKSYVETTPTAASGHPVTIAASGQGVHDLSLLSATGNARRKSQTPVEAQGYLDVTSFTADDSRSDPEHDGLTDGSSDSDDLPDESLIPFDDFGSDIATDPSQSERELAADVIVVCSWCQTTFTSLSDTASLLDGCQRLYFCTDLCTQALRNKTLERKTCDWCSKSKSKLMVVEPFPDSLPLLFCEEKCLNLYKMDIFCKETLEQLKNLEEADGGLMRDNLHNPNSEMILITPELWSGNGLEQPKPKRSRQTRSAALGVNSGIRSTGSGRSTGSKKSYNSSVRAPSSSSPRDLQPSTRTRLGISRSAQVSSSIGTRAVNGGQHSNKFNISKVCSTNNFVNPREKGTANRRKRTEFTAGESTVRKIAKKDTGTTGNGSLSGSPSNSHEAAPWNGLTSDVSMASAALLSLSSLSQAAAAPSSAVRLINSIPDGPPLSAARRRFFLANSQPVLTAGFPSRIPPYSPMAKSTPKICCQKKTSNCPTTRTGREERNIGQERVNDDCVSLRDHTIQKKVESSASRPGDDGNHNNTTDMNETDAEDPPIEMLSMFSIRERLTKAHNRPIAANLRQKQPVSTPSPAIGSSDPAHTKPDQSMSRERRVSLGSNGSISNISASAPCRSHITIAPKFSSGNAAYHSPVGSIFPLSAPGAVPSSLTFPVPFIIPLPIPIPVPIPIIIRTNAVTSVTGEKHIAES